jgi:hypothetical protein
LVLPRFAWLGDGNEIGTYSPLLDYFIGNSLVSETKVTCRFTEWSVEDRVFDDDLFHLSDNLKVISALEQ